MKNLRKFEINFLYFVYSYDIAEVVNNNPVEFLQNSFDAHNVKCRVDVLVNDSAGKFFILFCLLKI